MYIIWISKSISRHLVLFFRSPIAGVLDVQAARDQMRWGHSRQMGVQAFFFYRLRSGQGRACYTKGPNRVGCAVFEVALAGSPVGPGLQATRYIARLAAFAGSDGRSKMCTAIIS